MSFIFNANQPVSPERQKIAKALLERRQIDMLNGIDAPAPTNIGEGIAALGGGIADGLEMRSLQHQAQGPTDAWADMRQPGQTMAAAPTGSMGFNNPLDFTGAFRRIFGG